MPVLVVPVLVWFQVSVLSLLIPEPLEGLFVDAQTLARDPFGNPYAQSISGLSVGDTPQDLFVDFIPC